MLHSHYGVARPQAAIALFRPQFDVLSRVVLGQIRW